MKQRTYILHANIFCNYKKDSGRRGVLHQKKGGKFLFETRFYLAIK